MAEKKSLISNRAATKKVAAKPQVMKKTGVTRLKVEHGKPLRLGFGHRKPVF
jgi:hypothetical protein